MPRCDKGMVCFTAIAMLGAVSIANATPNRGKPDPVKVAKRLKTKRLRLERAASKRRAETTPATQFRTAPIGASDLLNAPGPRLTHRVTLAPTGPDLGVGRIGTGAPVSGDSAAWLVSALRHIDRIHSGVSQVGPDSPGALGPLVFDR